MPSTLRGSSVSKFCFPLTKTQLLSLFVLFFVAPTRFFSWGTPGDVPFMPHGYCYQWDARLIFLHVTSDSIIFLSYLSIPFTLVYITRRRKDVPFNWMVLCFGTFIVACGFTHLMEVWTLWHPSYWLSGVIKAVTATASLATAVLLVRLVPQALALPSPDALQAEVVRREHAETRFRSLLEAAPDAIVVADHRGRIILVNARMKEIFGYERSELMGQQIDLLVREGFRQKYIDGRNDVTSQAGVRATEEEIELCGLHKDGSEFPIEITYSPLSTEEGTLILSAIRDITQRKRKEEAIQHLNQELARRNADLVAANHELESFSYSVSHDLRAPLRAIDGFSLALLEDCNDQLPEDGKADLARIRSAATRMGQLIDDMLRLSRIVRSEIRFESVDLSKIVHEVASDLRALEPDRVADIRISPEMKVQGDRHLLRVMIENLLGNAWKFTSKREGARIEVGLQPQNTEDVFFIRDNGSGFDMRYADKLFGVFQRLHSEKDYPGTGVGLATVQRIVNKHSGRIWAESKVDQGTTFYFSLHADGVAQGV